MKRAHLYLALGAAAVVGFGALYLLRPNGRASHGVRLVYALDAPAPGRAVMLDEAAAVVRARLAQTDVDQPSVTRQGETLVVELPGVDDEAAARVRWLLDRPARFELAMVLDGSDAMHAIFLRVASSDERRAPGARDQGIEARVDEWRHEPTGDAHVDHFLVASDRDRQSGREILARFLATATEDDEAVGRFGYEYVEPPADAEAPRPYWRTYYMERQPRLDNRAVASAEASRNAYTERPEVVVTFTPAGAQTFAELTAAHVGHKLAVLLDGRITSAPIIQEPIRGGQAWVQVGGGTREQQAAEAKALAAALRSGPLPAPLRVESVSRWGEPPADP